MELEKLETRRVREALMKVMLQIAPYRKVKIIPVFDKVIRAGYKALSLRSITINIED
jgi:hypothetical protein